MPSFSSIHSPDRAPISLPMPAAYYLESIERNRAINFGAGWMHRTFEGFWRSWAQWVVEWTNSMLVASPHQAALMAEAAGNPELAAAIANGYDDPRQFFQWWFDPEAAARFRLERLAAPREVRSAGDTSCFQPVRYRCYRGHHPWSERSKGRHDGELVHFGLDGSATRTVVSRQVGNQSSLPRRATSQSTSWVRSRSILLVNSPRLLQTSLLSSSLRGSWRDNGPPRSGGPVRVPHRAVH